MKMALTLAPLPAVGARPVHLQAVGADLEVSGDVGETAPVHRASLELGYLPALLADEVMVIN
jgi:hypothetical protein